MKKYSLFLIIGLFVFSASAQYVPVYPLVEHFTNTRCPICPPLNSPFYQTMANNEGFVHQVSYHPPVPYPQDTFYRENPTPQNTRRQHYGVSGTPRAFFNGKDERQNQDLVPPTLIAAAKEVKTGLEIQVDELLVQGDMEVLVSLRNVNQDSLTSSANLRLFVILIEDSVDFPAPNGENLHYNIFREALTAIEGQSFNLPAQDAANLFNFSYQVKPHWNVSHLHALAFVFDENGNFYNSGSSQNLRVSTSSTVSNNQNDGTATVVAKRGKPPYTYLWNDPDNQTTATASGLNGGEYLVTVTDDAGISIQEKVLVQTQVNNEASLLFKGKISTKERAIRFQDFPDEKLDVQMFGLDGQKIWSTKVRNGGLAKLPVLPTGLYVVEVSGKQGQYREKIWIR